MRLWSLHPRYLDTKGLVACWREGLLARKVLMGLTKGYRRHPQLERFRSQSDPVGVLDRYLLGVLEEGSRRGFAFNRSLIGPRFSKAHPVVTRGQLEFEMGHLASKLKMRDAGRYEEIVKVESPLPNPVFRVIDGPRESWEKSLREALKDRQDRSPR